MRKVEFLNNEIYHIYNRGVEKRNIFLDEKDYFRFIHDLFEFNNEEPTLNVNYYFHNQPLQTMEVRPPYLARKPRIMIVNILAFCLMPNHYHLLLEQKKDGGIVKFMQKMGTGYTMFFNEKYERSGHLFQGKFRAILAEQENYFNHLLYYIHLNPLDLVEPRWREGEIKDYQKAIKFLENYRWSSHIDYTGKKNFPSLTQRGLFLGITGGAENYKQNIKDWLQELASLHNNKEFKTAILE